MSHARHTIPDLQSAAVPAALAQLTCALCEADTPEGVIAGGRALIDQWAPRTRVQRTARTTPLAPSEPGINLRISDTDYLALTARDRAAAGVVQPLARAIGARLDQARQFAALSREVERLSRSERLQRALYAIADQASAAGTDLSAMFHALHRIVGTLMYAENFYIAFYDVDKDSIRFPYYADSMDREVPSPDADAPLATMANGPTWYVLKTGEPLMGSLAEMGAQVGGSFQTFGAPCEDYLGVPLQRGAQTLGCVAVQSYDKRRRYDAQDKALLIYVAQHIQTALERRLAHVELERRVEARTAELHRSNDILQREVSGHQRSERMQTALFRIAELANTVTNLHDFYSAVHRVVGDLLDARNFYIALLAADGTELTFPYYVDEKGDPYTTRKLGKGLTEYVMREGIALRAGAADIAALRAAGQATQQGSNAVSWLGVPLICNKRTVGALAVQSYSAEHTYSARDQELLTFVSYHIANALERVRAAVSLRAAKADLELRVEERTRALAAANQELRAEIEERERVEQRLKYETLHDALTGLPNRAALLRKLDVALQRFRGNMAPSFAVLFLDLDRFKVINDSAGHIVGDELLIQAGRRIRASVKPNDVVARLGGDEFAVLLENIADVTQACTIAQRIIDSFNVSFHVNNKELFTATSVGVALAATDYRRSGDMLRDADSAMYRAKAEGRHRCAVFDDSLRLEAVRLLEVENDLRRAPSRHEFVPYYQPIVALNDGRIVGYEALMRWRHPRRGLLLPADFLGAADDIGVSESIDWQVYEQVCEDVPRLLQRSGMFVSINLPPRYFRSPGLDQRVLGMLARHSVTPGNLRIEVTEHAMLANPPEVKRVLNTLRAAGVSIALDDFGTGYSSLSYLHQYPVQALKIDRSFVASLAEANGRGGEAIIRTIIAMSHLLSMQVVAEGVETTAQRDQLLRMGCRYAQGFLYGRAQPLPAAATARTAT
ncbi:MAG TPA: EAL domain-containing protein [Rhodanobacteraceae bacterium]